MQRLPLFATPLTVFEIPDMDDVNRELTDRLVAESNTVPSDRRSNVGGWHSRTDLHTRSERCYQVLFEQIIKRVFETSEAIARENGQQLPQLVYKSHAWAMVMRKGHYTIPHDHSEVHWATVYYPDPGDADEKQYPDSGLLALIDPRHGGRPIPGLDLVGQTFYARPKVGMLLIFPGWLLHYVNAYEGERPRVTIACNVTFALAPPQR